MGVAKKERQMRKAGPAAYNKRESLVNADDYGNYHSKALFSSQFRFMAPSSLHRIDPRNISLVD